MEEFKLNDLPIEFQDKYKELVEKYKIDRIFYIEDENKLLNLGDLEIEGYTMRMSKSLKTLLPIKKYFTIVL